MRHSWAAEVLWPRLLVPGCKITSVWSLWYLLPEARLETSVRERDRPGKCSLLCANTQGLDLHDPAPGKLKQGSRAAEELMFRWAILRAVLSHPEGRIKTLGERNLFGIRYMKCPCFAFHHFIGF